MRKLLALSLVTLSLGAGSLFAQRGTRTMTIEEVNSGKFAAQPAGRGMRSMSDGLHYTMMDTQHKAILRYSFATGKLIDTLFSVDRARDCEFQKFDDYRLEPKGHHILLITDQEQIYRRSHKGNAYHYDVRRNRVEPLSDTKGKVMIPTFSPDGRMVAFVRDGNIFIKKFEFDTEVQVTNDAERNKVMNGITDWVYEEEFETTRLLSWSEDSGYLAFVRTDETQVQEYSMPMYGTSQYPTSYTYKYPKAGTPNSRVSLHIYNVVDRSRKEVNFRDGAPYYIPRIEFVGREGQLAVFTLNRQQNHLRLFYVQNKTLLPKLILEDKSKTYVDSHNVTWSRFIPSGFIYPSERDGFRHLYHYSDKGVLLRQVTSGHYDVTNFYGADASGNLYYQAADESPMRRSIYRIDPKGKRIALHPGQGSNQAIFSDSFAYYISTFNNTVTPTVTAVYATGSLKPLRVLEDNQKLQHRLEEYRVAPKEFITLTGAEGQAMNAWIVKPHDFSPTRRYPVLMIQYSGPDSQQVLDQYGYGWEQVLASHGFIVVCVDGRGTGARGEEWRKCTYLRLGVKESADQIAAAKALGKLPYVDANRIGIWGWSFGGYNTLMSLCHGDGTFKVGIAVAPVTDWRFYDTIYTERFMRTPQENPDGYKASSVLEVAHNLRGKLLLIHGSADDNVHVQNAMDFAELLVQRDLPFDMALYTDKNHSIYGGKTRDHLFKKMISYLQTNL
ncbi:peptidase, S9A/B/C family, catalytic domain protein [Porphyromonas catoniae F0037]|uniref:Peptidase, S9A/B/C family, catalytic domain protein n=1 Tax=Porphyromonas catoniae F0037 TaxID=1127696 RepID=L1NAP9_9PORP|nr:S9 family peptidase [Porphyromonas catoniae]EKY00401.1 peptidase, S9A/B/C family, catalytic domain protein [Porphyromonas catoniae F0037]